MADLDLEAIKEAWLNPDGKPYFMHTDAVPALIVEVERLRDDVVFLEVRWRNEVKAGTAQRPVVEAARALVTWAIEGRDEETDEAFEALRTALDALKESHD